MLNNTRSVKDSRELIIDQSSVNIVYICPLINFVYILSSKTLVLNIRTEFVMALFVKHSRSAKEKLKGNMLFEYAHTNSFGRI